MKRHIIQTIVFGAALTLLGMFFLFWQGSRLTTELYKRTMQSDSTITHNRLVEYYKPH